MVSPPSLPVPEVDISTSSRVTLAWVISEPYVSTPFFTMPSILPRTTKKITATAIMMTATMPPPMINPRFMMSPC